MQRSLSAVVLVSVLAVLPGRASAQSAAAPEPARPPAAAPARSGAIPAVASDSSRRQEDRLSDEAELARVVSVYEAGKYAECSSEVERLLDPLGKSPLRQPSIVENARVYWAACLLGAGQTQAAEAPLRAAIHENPQMKPPDSLVFPQPVVQLFLKVRDSLVKEIRAAEQARIEQARTDARKREQALERDRSRLVALEELARQETVVVRNRRVLSLIPFGVGQLQNRQEVLGYGLMISEVLLASLSLTAVAVQSRRAVALADLRRSGLIVDDEAENAKQEAWGIARDVSFWAFAALAVGGVVQAQIEYVPEFRETRTRPLPPTMVPSPPVRKVTSGSLSYVPYVDQKGGGLNLIGRF